MIIVLNSSDLLESKKDISYDQVTLQDFSISNGIIERADVVIYVGKVTCLDFTSPVADQKVLKSRDKFAILDMTKIPEA